MSHFISDFRRVWRKSPKLAITFVRRRMKKKARLLLPKDDWNGNWLGEEMRPFNSLHR